MTTEYPYGRFKLKAYCQVETEEIVDLRDNEAMTEENWNLKTESEKEKYLQEWNKEIVQAEIVYWAISVNENTKFELD